MTYILNNADDISKIRIHDSVFTGFEYETEESSIHISCENRYLKKTFSMSFKNVICIHMQSCRFWGLGNSVQCIYKDNDGFINDLMQKQNENNELYDGSRLAGNTQLFTISMEINSGDVLSICCSEVEVIEIDN